MEVEDIVKEIVESVVDRPEDVIIRTTTAETSNTTIIEIEVDNSDVGKVLGRKGNLIDSIRRICMSIGGKNDHRYVLQVIE